MVTFIPPAIYLDGVPVGDVGPPLAGMRRALEGGSPYEVMLRIGPVPQYPFTAMIVVAPLLLLPTRLVPMAFCALATGAFAWSLTRDGHWWRLMALLSAPHLAAIDGVQWAPFATAALLLPALLPVSVVKPQLGLVLAAAGRWTRLSLAATVGLVVMSLLIRPGWPVEWFASGTHRLYQPGIPLLILPGVLLVVAAAFVRSARGRLVLAMAITPQRFIYDQLLLFVVPRTGRQMLFLLVASWAGALAGIHMGWWHPASGEQPLIMWRVTILTHHLPALAILVSEWWRADARRVRAPGGDGPA